MIYLKFHQGDVIGSSIKSLPSSASKISNKPIAIGEMSDHVHILTGDVELLEYETRTFATVGKSGARLQHISKCNMLNENWKAIDEIDVADHKSILLPEGKYEFWIQRSYNPFEKIMEDLID